MTLPKELTTVTPLSKALAMILFILLPFLGFYLGTSYQEVIDFQNQQVTAPATLKPHPAQSTNSTANWKTYTNRKYSYSLKYPSDWNEKVKCRGGTSQSDYICFLSQGFSESPVPVTLTGSILIIDAQSDGSYWVVDTPDNFCTQRAITDPAITDCKSIKIGGAAGMRKTFQKEFPWVDIGVIRDNKFVLSIRLDYAKGFESVALKTFEQILSTFKFIN